MQDFFSARRTAARARGLAAKLTFVARAVADLVTAAWHERWRRPLVTAPSRPSLLTGLRDDLRTATRRVRRAPGLTLGVIGLLALTIGSATVVFSVVNAALLRSLPFEQPDRIMMIWETRANSRENNVGAHEYPVWARQNKTFADLAAIIYDEGIHLTGAGEPAALLGVRVSESFFRVMGVQPSLGRSFTKDEDQPGHGQVVVISDRLWRERFASATSALDRDVLLNGTPYRVVGVMPASFAFPPAGPGMPPDLWSPIAENIEQQAGRHHLFVVGRLKDGTSIAQAQADMSLVAAAIAKAFPQFSAGHGVSVQSLQEHMGDNVRASLLLLLGAVGCLLLIGCTNVASLLLARGLLRRREIGLELALGATRWRVARQLFAESVVMSAAGGALGLALASWLAHLVPALIPPDALNVDAIVVDRTVLAFAAAISIFTGLLFGVAPVIQLRRVGPADTLKRGGRSLFGGEHTRLRRALVSVQIALAVLLVLGASLMARALVALHDVDPGFVTSGTLSVDLTLRGPRYEGQGSAVKQRAFFDAVESQAAAIPGVASAGAIDNLPLSGHASGMGIAIEGHPGDAVAQYRVVSPGFFKTMGIRLVEGREFASTDARLAVPLIRWWPEQPLPARFNEPQAQPVAVINESMARAFWPDGALGRRFTVIASPPITVVGVIADTHTVTLRAGTGPEFYLTSAQEPQSSMSVVVRAMVPPLGLVPAVRGVIAHLDPALPIVRVTTMDVMVDKMLGGPRFTSTLLGVFAGLALVLMIVGVYGLLKFTTSQRLPEMGVRIALGAGRRDIHRLIFLDAFGMTAVGVAIGVAAALALGRYISDQLFGVTPTDTLTLLTVPAVVTAVVALACWRPARRAARIDPVVVLRQD